MAVDYFAGKLDDEEEKKRAQGEVGQSVGQESPVVAGDSQQQPGSPTRSGSFTNLQSYLDANESRKFGEEFAGKVQGRVNDANAEQQKADQGFRSDVTKGSVSLDQGLLDEAKATPTVVNQDTKKKESFTQMRDAQYKGPEDFVGSDYYSPTKVKTDLAATSGELSKNESGRKALLDDFYGGKSDKKRFDYSSGQKKLDNYLIQTDPGSREALQTAQSGAEASKSNFDSLLSQLNSFAGQKKAETSQTRSATRGMLGVDDSDQRAVDLSKSGAIQDTYNPIVQRSNDSRAARQASIERILSALKNRNVASLSPQERSRVGLSDDTRTYGVDPTKYFTYKQAPEGVFANPQEAERLNALVQLAATDPNKLPMSMLPEESQDTLEQLTSFDPTGFYSEANAKQNALDQLINSTPYTTYSGAFDDDNVGAHGPGQMGLYDAKKYYEQQLPLQSYPQGVQMILDDINKRIDDLRRQGGYYDTLQKR